MAGAVHLNTGALAGWGGKLKIWTLLLGAVIIGLASHAANYQTYREHENFFYSAVICFIISLALLVLGTIGLLDILGGVLIKVDAIYHLLAACLLAASGIIFIIHVNDHRGGSDPTFAEQISAGALGLLNSLVYGQIAWLGLQ